MPALMGTGAASVGPLIAAISAPLGFLGGFVKGVGGGRDEGGRCAGSEVAMLPARAGGISGDMRISARRVSFNLASMMLTSSTNADRSAP